MGLYRAEGIVLANRDLGEADRIVVLFCRDQGRLEAVARGARRPRNRLVGLTLPFNLLRLSLFSGRSLDEVSQVEGIRSFPRLHGDLILLAHASYLAELTSGFLPEREPDPGVFALLLESLALLEEGGDPEEVAGFFTLHLLEGAGFRPAFDRCLACGRVPGTGETSLFSATEGGIRCRACSSGKTGLAPLSGPQRSALQKGLEGERSFLAGMPAADRRAVQRLLCSFAETHLDKELRSLRFLAGLLAEDRSGK